MTSTEVSRNHSQLMGPGKVPIRLRVNGQRYELLAEPRRTLLDALRYDLNLTGSKRGCDQGQCGACTVIANGQAVYSCMMLAIECQDMEITTIEGIGKNGELHPVQSAFIERDALQCGFCTPGQIMSVVALLDKEPAPTENQIRRAISGNLCRCGTYHQIVSAVQVAAARMREEQ